MTHVHNNFLSILP